MGMFDEVMVPCPTCGTKQPFQSKSGDCRMAVYELAECPPDVLADVNRHSPYTCETCGEVFAVQWAARAVKYIAPIGD